MGTMRVTLKAVNDERAERGFMVRLVKASGYFFFQGGEADDWLDKTVSVRNVSSFSLPEWIAEFERLKELNGEIMGGTGGKQAAKKRSGSKSPGEDGQFKRRASNPRINITPPLAISQTSMDSGKPVWNLWMRPLDGDEAVQ